MISLIQHMLRVASIFLYHAMMRDWINIRLGLMSVVCLLAYLGLS